MRKGQGIMVMDVIRDAMARYMLRIGDSPKYLICTRLGYWVLKKELYHIAMIHSIDRDLMKLLDMSVEVVEDIGFTASQDYIVYRLSSKPYVTINSKSLDLILEGISIAALALSDQRSYYLP